MAKELTPPLGDTTPLEHSESLNASLEETMESSPPESRDFLGNSQIPLEGIGETLTQEKNTTDSFFLDDTSSSERPLVEVDDEKEKFVSKYIRRFLWSSFFTVLNLVLLGLIFSYNLYLTQASTVHTDKNYVNYVSSYKGYLRSISSYLGGDKESTSSNFSLGGVSDEANIANVIHNNGLSYIQKRDILKNKVVALMNATITKTIDIENTKKDIARFGFLPEEIRTILQGDSTISAIQRSLNSLEVIKFTTALKVFSYMDSVASLVADSLHMKSEEVLNILHNLSERGEKDASPYVYICYLNPFETSNDCTTIGDFDLYYQYILKDTEFNRNLFKNIMRSLDSILEQNAIPNFSLLFNGFNAMAQTINFTIEVNTSKADELKLIAKGIHSPHIFIFTNLINLLKQSAFIIGGDINTKSIDIATRTLDIGSVSYVVNTSSKSFSLPIQKTTEREIFDYIDIESLMNLDIPSSVDTPVDTTEEEINEGEKQQPLGEATAEEIEIKENETTEHDEEQSEGTAEELPEEEISPTELPEDSSPDTQELEDVTENTPSLPTPPAEEIGEELTEIF